MKKLETKKVAAQPRPEMLKASLKLKQPKHEWIHKHAVPTAAEGSKATVLEEMTARTVEYAINDALMGLINGEHLPLTKQALWETTDAGCNANFVDVTDYNAEEYFSGIPDWENQPAIQDLIYGIYDAQYHGVRQAFQDLSLTPETIYTITAESVRDVVEAVAQTYKQSALETMTAIESMRITPGR